MKTILVDDEIWAMEQFSIECQNNPTFEVVGKFCFPTDALEYAKDNRVDFALLDFEMPEMNGIELGKELKKLYPEIIIIYVTAYEEVTVDALKMKADFVVLKPYGLNDVMDALKRAKLLYVGQKKRVFIRTFGKFDVFVDGVTVAFSSKKAKELLALLVDKKGGALNTEEAYSVLWEDKPYNDAGYSLCRKVYKHLSTTLEEAGIANIVSHEKNERWLNTAEVDCDYYAYLDGDKKAVDSFAGEYMTNYSWAEETLAKLVGEKYEYY